MRLKFKNFLDTVESFWRNDATTPRVYQFPNKDITVAGLDDVQVVQDGVDDINIALQDKADLVAGKVPSSQLPAYVDDVVAVANFAALPATGTEGLIYITLDNNHQFRWTDDGDIYVDITGGVALGETSSTAYRGDRGKIAYDASVAAGTKDVSNGFPGLTLLKINFLNALGTFTSFFTNANTTSRTYTFQNRDGTIADDTDLALKSPLASPTFTGTPAAPTAATGTDTAQLATTAFVQQEIGNLLRVAVNGAVALDATAFGKAHICTGTSADYNVTLPSPTSNGGKMIMFKGSHLLTKVVTLLQNSADTIDGETSRQFSGHGEIWLLCDGTNWIIVNEVGSWMPWSPTYTGFTTPPTGIGRFRRQGKTYTIELISGLATSTQTFFTVTLPPNVLPLQSSFWIIQGTNNSAGVAGRAGFTAGSNVVTLNPTTAGGSWTNSNLKGCYLMITFEAQ